jgi:hypothetical protein
VRLLELPAQPRDGSTQALQLGALFVGQLDAPVPSLIGLSHGRYFAFRRPTPARRAPSGRQAGRSEDGEKDARGEADWRRRALVSRRPPGHPHTSAPTGATRRGRCDSIWSGVPEGTRSPALVVDDPDTQRAPTPNGSLGPRPTAPARAKLHRSRGATRAGAVFGHEPHSGAIASRCDTSGPRCR